MTSEKMPSRRTDALANHTRILEAAQVVLGERGLDLEVNEVADRAGVGVGTLYRHFANRDDLIQATLARIFEDVLSLVRAAAAIEDPGAALRQIPHTFAIDRVVFALLQDPRCTKLLRDMKQTHRSLSEELTGLVAGIVERGIHAGAFRADLDPAATAIAILGSTGAVFESLGATRPLSELADMVADLHGSMVVVR